MKSYSESYRAAGVDVTAGYRAVERIRRLAEKTRIPGVVSGVGGFGGLFRPNFSGMEDPVLVSGTDGGGTKLKIAALMGKNDAVGVDCVAMCVNDVVCSGAKPLFFLDYLAVGKNSPEAVESIVSGVAEGCLEAGCALIGGETAEMPGFYPPDGYDLAGFAVGCVDRPKIIDGSLLKPGDALVGIGSSGLHSNGFSLVRKVFGVSEKNIGERVPEFGRTLGEELLTPTRIYVKALLSLMGKVRVKAVSHITGGGFYENIPRMLRPGIEALIRRSALPKMPVFSLLQGKGHISDHDMFNTFNMGIGMCLAVAAEDADRAVRELRSSGERAFLIGEITSGSGGVVLC